MYPIERYMSTLKSYVRNRSRPEGSIAEAYLLDESLTLCSRYLDDVETKFNKVGRNDDDGGEESNEFPIFSKQGRHIGKESSVVLDHEKIKKAHQYALFNCSAVEPFIRHTNILKHQVLVARQNSRLGKKDIERIHSETFADWFSNHVEALHLSGEEVHEELRALARGPNPSGKRYRGFIINGFRFHVKAYESRRRTQNSSLVITAKTSSFASRSDNNPIVGDVSYYGVLNDIIVLDYLMGRKIVMFDCDWVSPGRAVKKDEYDFTLVNFSLSRGHSEPFVLASQAQQVFYVEDPADKGWHVVVTTKARDFYDLDPISTVEENVIQDTNALDQQTSDEVETENLVRKDVEGTII